MNIRHVLVGIPRFISTAFHAGTRTPSFIGLQTQYTARTVANRARISAFGTSPVTSASPHCTNENRIMNDRTTQHCLISNDQLDYRQNQLQGK